MYELVKQELYNYFKVDADKLNLEQQQKFLLRLQCKLFEVGTNSSQTINAIRFSIDRAAMTLKKEFNFKSVQSVAYLKRLFVKYEIADVVKTKLHSVNGERAYKYFKGYAANYNKQTKQPVWILTDAIVFK